MSVLVRCTVLSLLFWLTLAGICLAKEVYLSDGSVIDARSAWTRGNKVYVNVNRDIIAEFNLSEVDMQRTFPGSVKRSGKARHVVRKGATNAKRVARKPVKPAGAVAAVVPVPKPAAPPGTTAVPAKPTPVTKNTPQPVTPPPPPAPAASSTPAPALAQPASSVLAPVPASQPPGQPSDQTVVQPSAPSEPASPPDKAELERRKQEAVKMMAEAIKNNDPELMKKAIEMQKSAVQQGGASGPVVPRIPFYIPFMFLALCLLMVVAQWVIFAKAGEAGWKSLIPFYNAYVLMEISGKPGWWMFLLLVPLVNVAIYFLAMISLAKRFGRSELFGVGICLLPFIFMPLLAFGDSRYQG